MTDHNTLWRHIVDAAGEILHAQLPSVDAVDRQQMALAIGTAAMERLAPQTAREKLDAFIAAFDTLAVHRADVSTVTDVDHIDHTVVLGVHTPAEVAALAAELDLPWPRQRENGDGYRWTESADYRERGTTIVIQGGHRSRNSAA